MCAQLMDGAKIAKEIRAEVGEEVKELTAAGVRPGLAVVLVGDNPASQIYVSSKTKASESLGIYSETITPPANITTAQLLDIINTLNNRDEIDGILVQLPLPGQIDTDTVLNAVDPRKDVDGFHPENVGRLTLKQTRFAPCTPAGIMEMLARTNIEVSRKRAVVIGRSRIVGMPMALLLTHADSTVTICHSRTNDIAGITREADILIAAIGRTGFITDGFIKPGSAVVDVGMNRLTEREQVSRYFPGDQKRMEEFERKGYTLIGDVDPVAAMSTAAYFTPVPGGVGPLTIAMLLKNTVKAARLRRAGRRSEAVC